MWKRRLLAAAATIMLALGTALPTVAMADAVDDLVAKAPDHAMTPTDTLVDNGDGTYDVTLSVTGATEETEIAKPIDIIYVVDRSLSMVPDLAAARRAISPPPRTNTSPPRTRRCPTISKSGWPSLPTAGRRK